MMRFGSWVELIAGEIDVLSILQRWSMLDPVQYIEGCHWASPMLCLQSSPLDASPLIWTVDHALSCDISAASSTVYDTLSFFFYHISLPLTEAILPPGHISSSRLFFFFSGFLSSSLLGNFTMVVH
ncbi:hypothetical protein Dimus_039806 [Dionaea muscipula]